MSKEKETDPDMQHNACYYRGTPMSPLIAEIHDDILEELGVLASLVKQAQDALYKPGAYGDALKFITTKDKYDERSEFSKRLARARALLAAADALEDAAKAGGKQ